MVESIREIIQPLAEEKGKKLKVEVPLELPLVTGAPNHLQQVLTNLLVNAVKFTPDRGAITLKSSEEDDHILVTVTDTGTGISTEELPGVFDDFYRGIRVDEMGAGWGLSMSKKIIEAHGGKIWADSPCHKSGVGSKFTFPSPKNQAITQGKKKEGV